LFFLLSVLLIILLPSCGPPQVEDRVEDLLRQMTLQEKIGQMIQVSKNGVRPGDVAEYFIGSILSPGGGSPINNSVEGWREMVTAFQDEALSTRLEIPLLYGVDAVHGHGNLLGATIFPHQIGLGATRNPELVRQIGQATAEEILATGIHWNFAPVLAAAQDIRWGRTYEAYSEDPALVDQLGAAYLQGLQTLPEDYTPAQDQKIFVLATPKHFLGDGGTTWGTSETEGYHIDQGDMLLDELAVRNLFLEPYQTAVDLGAMSVMPSYSSWNGVKMHAQQYWLTDVLKEELGFGGLIISDYNALIQIDEDYYTAVVTGINAGVDMNMISSDFKGLISIMEKAVANGDISEDRIDDAVRRILTVKFMLGLFDRPYAGPQFVDQVGSEEHRQLARQAVRESLVLLKNDQQVLPLDKNAALIHVAGMKADSIGVQSGGWTITWQGIMGNLQPGTTILEAIQESVSADTSVEYSSKGSFESSAEYGVVVVGETPYAEGAGDKDELRLSESDIKVIQNARETSEYLIVVILSGRPLIISEQVQMADAWVAAWLPGTEGSGITDVLFGDYPFTGKLPFTWPRSNEQLPMNIHNLTENAQGCDAPLFPFGYGLGAAGSAPIEWIDCP
jgi:beta-glucosidase